MSCSLRSSNSWSCGVGSDKLKQYEGVSLTSGVVTVTLFCSSYKVPRMKRCFDLQNSLSAQRY